MVKSIPKQNFNRYGVQSKEYANQDKRIKMHALKEKKDNSGFLKKDNSGSQKLLTGLDIVEFRLHIKEINRGIMWNLQCKLK